MVDFRKWLLALTSVGLLLGIGSVAANAQSTGTFTCNASAGVPNIVRAEGLTELLGDLVLNCTGGIPTAGGSPIPLQNVQISINTNITSRLINSTNVSEALLLIDEPYPATTGNPPPPIGPTATVNNAQAQLACLAINNTNCEIFSSGVGIGTTGSYNGSAGHYNIFQGVQTGVNTIAWTGVPIDAPGTAGTRVVRITNIRGNAFQLGVSSTLVPTQISMIVAVNGSTTILILQPSNGNVVGQVTPGLLSSAITPNTYSQCNSVNTYLLTPAGTVSTDSGIGVTAKEGFAYSFKPQNYNQYYSVRYGLSASYIAPGGTFFPQNLPGFPYDVESGFAPAAGLTGLTQPTSGADLVGYADRGTQLTFTTNGIGAGVSLFAPSYVYMTGPYGTGTPIGVAVLVNASSSTSGAFTTTTTVPVAFAGTTVPANGPSVPVTVSGTTASLVYEVYYSDPNVQESLAVPISVAYTSNTGSNIPATTTTASTAGIMFNPQSTVGTASSGPVPRFGPSGTPSNFFTITPCSCNLLFPFVTNIAGFDTGIAIANTSLDPYGTSPQTGTVVLNYYGTTTGGGAAPPAATTTSAIPGGAELVFTVSSGGNYGIGATPGFEGYIIAQANFQFCHGFAFISDVGAQKLAEGYLAIQLDAPGLTRTSNTGENKGN